MLSFMFKPKKHAIQLTADHDVEFAEQYDRLANKLGVACRSQRTSVLPAILQDLMIEVYDQAAVERYMDKRGYWGWYALRQKDFGWTIHRETLTEYRALYGSMEKVYGLPVPYPVLLTVEQISEKCPTARFMVAALRDNPDPFLGVFDSNGGQVFIVERWDEPGFRG